MVIKWLSRSSIVSTVALLLFSTNNNNDVCATYQAMQVDNFSKVVRIDLSKHFVPHHEIEELEEDEENDQITIEVEDVSYAQLRSTQQGHIARSFSKMQKSSQNLLQTNEQTNSDSTLTIDTANAVDLDTSITTEADLSAEATQATENKGTAKAHEKQLVSEIADASEDNKDDLALQVPLTSRNDAVYMGTVYMGSPVSQPARVVFDTGSEYLAITSALCDDKTSGNFKFKKYDPLSGSFVQRD